MRECGQDRNIYQRIRNPVLLSYSLLPMFRKNTSKSSYLNKFKHNENNLTFRIYKMCICAENISKYISLCACSGIIFYFSFLFAFISVAFVFKLTFSFLLSVLTPPLLLLNVLSATIIPVLQIIRCSILASSLVFFSLVIKFMNSIFIFQGVSFVILIFSLT